MQQKIAVFPGDLSKSLSPAAHWVICANPLQSARIVTNARLSKSIMADALGAMDGTYERDARPLAMEAEFQTRCFLLADGTLDLTAGLSEYFVDQICGTNPPALL